VLRPKVRIIECLFALTTTACVAACGQGGASDARVLAEIDAARTAFWDAHEQGDASALADLVTDDAVLWAPGMEDASGRAFIRTAAEGMFAAMSISDFEIESYEVQLHDALAYELATYSETLTPRDGQASVVRGRYLIVWRRDSDGRWRVHRNMFHFIAGPQ